MSGKKRPLKIRRKPTIVSYTAEKNKKRISKNVKKRRLKSLNNSKLQKTLKVMKKIKNRNGRNSNQTLILTNSHNNEEDRNEICIPFALDNDTGPSDVDINCSFQKTEETQSWQFSFDEADDKIHLELNSFNEEFRYIQSSEDQIKWFPVSKTAAVVVMLPNSVIAFRGLVEIQVIKGSIDVFGYLITYTMGKIPIFSPASGCALTLVPTVEKEYPHGLLNSNFLKQFHFNKNIKKKVLNFIELNHSSVVFLLHKNDTFFSRFLNSHFSNLFKPKSKDELAPLGIEELLGQFVSISPYQKSVLKIYDSWLNIEAILKQNYFEHNRPVRILVCGSKDIGKSTLIRYLINSFLNECNNVYLLDGDPGQSECTPPGCVSFVKINKPLLGPAFTHSMIPEKSCFVGIDVECCPDHYLACIKELQNTFDEVKDEHLPLFINTMGWITGLGFKLLIDLITITKPTHILQLSKGTSRIRNFERLTPEYLQEAKGWLFSSLTSEEFNHKLLDVEGVLTEKEMIFSSPILRDIGLFAYFGQMQNHLLNHQKAIHAYTPYKIPWSAFGVCVHYEKIPFHQILYALNGSLVALGICDSSLFLDSGDDSLPKFMNDIPVCPCVGYAIVRGIDMEERCLYLITPIEWKILKQVNILIKGVLKLPDMIIANQKIDGYLPYVMNATKKILTRQGLKKKTFKSKERQRDNSRF